MELNSSNIFTQILIVIDTEYVKAHYPMQRKPLWKKPVQIAHDSQYLFAYDPRGINSGQGSGDLDLNAWLGDGIDFACTSIYQNSSDAVILYGVQEHAGDNIFSPFSAVTIERADAVTPDSQSPNYNGLPPLHDPQNFNKLLSRVIDEGKADLLIQFGLYTLDSDGQAQNLYGYFSWDPTVSISGVA
jgi:nematocidal protein AidA